MQTGDGSKILGLCADPKSSTYWIFTNDSIFEIIVKDEARDVWKIMLGQKSFDAALRFANVSPLPSIWVLDILLTSPK